MFKIKKTMELSIAHNLDLPYESKCRNSHGHNLLATIYVAADELNSVGMVVDFTLLKQWVHDRLDHSCLNDLGIEELQACPTAERVAFWITTTVDKYVKAVNPTASCYRVDVQESEGNVATFIDRSE